MGNICGKLLDFSFGKKNKKIPKDQESNTLTAKTKRKKGKKSKNTKQLPKPQPVSDGRENDISDEQMALAWQSNNNRRGPQPLPLSSSKNSLEVRKRSNGDSHYGSFNKTTNSPSITIVRQDAIPAQKNIKLSSGLSAVVHKNESKSAHINVEGLPQPILGPTKYIIHEAHPPNYSDQYDSGLPPSKLLSIKDIGHKDHISIDIDTYSPKEQRNSSREEFFRSMINQGVTVEVEKPPQSTPAILHSPTNKRQYLEDLTIYAQKIYSLEPPYFGGQDSMSFNSHQHYPPAAIAPQKPQRSLTRINNQEDLQDHACIISKEKDKLIHDNVIIADTGQAKTGDLQENSPNINLNETSFGAKTVSLLSFCDKKGDTPDRLTMATEDVEKKEVEPDMVLTGIFVDSKIPGIENRQLLSENDNIQLTNFDPALLAMSKSTTAGQQCLDNESEEDLKVPNTQSFADSNNGLSLNLDSIKIKDEVVHSDMPSTNDTEDVAADAKKLATVSVNESGEQNHQFILKETNNLSNSQLMVSDDMSSPQILKNVPIDGTEMSTENNTIRVNTEKQVNKYAISSIPPVNAAADNIISEEEGKDLRKKVDYLNKILHNAVQFEDEIDNFTELENSNKYFYIEKSLTRLIDKLDDMDEEIRNNNFLRQNRKKVYKYLFCMLDALDEKLEENRLNYKDK